MASPARPPCPEAVNKRVSEHVKARRYSEAVKELDVLKESLLHSLIPPVTKLPPDIIVRIATHLLPMERVIAAQVNKLWRTTLHDKLCLWQEASIIIRKELRAGQLALQLQFYDIRTRKKSSDQRRSAGIQGVLELSIHMKEPGNFSEVKTMDTITTLLYKCDADSVLFSLRSLSMSNTSRPACVSLLRAISHSPRAYPRLRNLRIAGECVDSALFSMCFERFHGRLETLVLLRDPVSGTDDREWPPVIPEHLSAVQSVHSPFHNALEYKRPLWKLVVEAGISLGAIAHTSAKDYSPLGLSLCRTGSIENLHTLHIGGDRMLSKVLTSGPLSHLRVLKLDHAIVRQTQLKSTKDMSKTGTEPADLTIWSLKLPVLEKLHITNSRPRTGGTRYETISPGMHLEKLEAPKLTCLIIENEGSIDKSRHTYSLNNRHTYSSDNAWIYFCSRANNLRELQLIETSNYDLNSGLSKLKSLEKIVVSGIKLPIDFIYTVGTLPRLQYLGLSDCTGIHVSSILKLAKSKIGPVHPLRIEIGECPDLGAEDVAKIEAELGPMKRKESLSD